MTVIDQQLPHNVKASEDEHFTNSMLLPFLKKIRKILNYGLIPVGHVCITVLEENPVEQLGYGVWEKIAEDRVLVGKGAYFDTLEGTGGALSHVHSVPSHQHETYFLGASPYMYLADDVEFGGSYQGSLRWSVATTSPASLDAIKTQLSGASDTGTGSSIQPYYTVNIWKRIK